MMVKLHYKDSNIQVGGYLFIACAEDYQYFLSGRYNRLPSLSISQSNGFLKNYNDIIGEYRHLNKDNKFFAMTPFAMRNTWQSSFYLGAESFARLQNVKEGNVSIFSPEWFLWAAQKVNVQVDPDDVHRARRDLYKIKWYRLYMAYQGVRFLWARRRPYQILTHSPRLFMASIWTKAGLEKWEQQGKDVFYADLPALLKKNGHETSILYHAEGHNKIPERSGAVSVVNMASYLKLSDWLWASWEIFSFRTRMPTELSFPVSPVRRDIARSLSNQIPLALISYRAVKNIVVDHKPDFISLYENNCWEQGLLAAAHAGGCRVTSLQHTAFSPALLKMDNFLPAENRPDKIITTGQETKSIMTDIMGHHGHIQTGYSLRYEAAPIITAPVGHKILILLQGAPDDALFLHMINQYFKVEDLIIRAHPSWPVYSDRFLFSKSSLSVDLSQSAVALYTGTTAAFEALSAGIPVIHIHLGGPIVADPLFRLQNCAVKKTWAEESDLQDMVKQVTSLSADKKKTAFDIAREYINLYFTPADSGAMDNLIRQIADE